MARQPRGGSRFDSGLLAACGVVGALALLLPPSARNAVAGALRGSILAPLVASQEWAEATRAVIVGRDDALQVRGQQAALALTAPALADENLVLRRMLGLSARLRDGFVVAEVLRGGPISGDYTLLLGVGADGGVEPFTPVVGSAGLVGMVEAVDASTATVLTWAHPDFRVSAMSLDESAFGIVQPHLGRGADRALLEMRGVPFRSALEPGTVIVSAGLGGVYPRGIPIGTVLEELVTSERWSRAYLLRPAVLPGNLDVVMVLREAQRERGVAGVWLSLAAADSAAKAAGAAGDSIARRDALAEVEARRAALAAIDSAQRTDSVMSDSLTRPDTLRRDSTVRRPAATAPTAPRRDSAPAVRRDSSTAVRRDSMTGQEAATGRYTAERGA